MPSECNGIGAFAVLLSLNIKFVNNFNKTINIYFKFVYFTFYTL